MKIIGAGLPKTGTKSLASALRRLGFNVHDHHEQLQFHCDEYIAAFKGPMPNFEEMYENVDATTDLPACIFYKEIFKAFPDAKVILSVRDDEESWRKSFLKTESIVSSATSNLLMILGLFLTPSGRKLWRLGYNVKKYVKNELDYTKHNNEVMATIPAKQLLVFNPKDGWESLCAFLGAEVPAIPYPRENVNSTGVPSTIKNHWHVRRMKRELAVMMAVFVVLLGCTYALLSLPYFKY
ncbi:predicted protein [Nematostella vectensis]|uniref:Sulfotransferase n=1 Tax=Nematostella vectensis TaxID=45351 RepID=A7S9S8_NEMVE|nr:uncharacterized protein LOC5511189 [Nematostella vectensis]EDO39565.1 predicted protein [Nematostella vectensis]|eukprot:XP_001631628.1 predicted protein [Nematostella vectensis]